MPPPKIYPPLYKCLPPPQFQTLKKVILNEYDLLEGNIPSPRFITYSHHTLRKELVRSKLIPTDEQFIDICLTLQDISNPAKETPAQLPTLKTQQARIRCNHPMCLTCKYLNCSNHFTSTKTKTTYTIRHSFSCTSTNLIYLITCKKCKKQYVGFSLTLVSTTTDRISLTRNQFTSLFTSTSQTTLLMTSQSNPLTHSKTKNVHLKNSES